MGVTLVVRLKARGRDGYLRMRCLLNNGDLFEFSEYVRLREREVEIIDYSFQWQRGGKLIRRWDNTPHHPEIETFPAHVHMGSDQNVHAFPPVSFRIEPENTGRSSICTPTG
ncbi:MAG: hypothetical protein J7J16_00945 [Deltaproteobacteria bacterium]|nr:hypothetical protein [Deltaproteobacteria bacterium]